MDSLAALQEKLGNTVDYGSRALNAQQLSELDMFDQKLRTLDSLCRESFQETLRDSYSVIASRLERGEALDGGQRKAVELLFTGEAKHYLGTENNFPDWIAELKRIMAELDGMRAAGLRNLADLMHVQALCRDAMHVLPEVLYYLRESERVRLFDENLNGDLSREQGRMLARMIRDLMASPHR
jgi:hypothetical protein